MTKEGWTGCNYRCSECGHVKFIITNTFQDEIWERCTDDCGWSAYGDKGPNIKSKEGEPTGFYKRRYKIIKKENTNG